MIFQHHHSSDDSTHCESTLPSHFPNIVHCQSRLELAKPPPPLAVSELGFEPKFAPGVHLHLPGMTLWCSSRGQSCCFCIIPFTCLDSFCAAVRTEVSCIGMHMQQQLVCS